MGVRVCRFLAATKASECLGVLRGRDVTEWTMTEVHKHTDFGSRWSFGLGILGLSTTRITPPPKPLNLFRD